MKLLTLIPALLACLPSFSQIVMNDSCHQAIEIFCGDAFSVDFTGHTPDIAEIDACTYSSRETSAWFKFTGTGDVAHFSLCNYTTELLILDGNCNELECADSTMRFPFYQCGNRSDEKSIKSQVGKTYYIYCNTLNPHLPSELSVHCFPPAENNFCETAKPIAVNAPYSYNHLSAYPSGHPVRSSYYYEYAQADTWYTFTGTGELLILDDLLSGAPFTSTLLKGDCSNYEVVPTEYFAGIRAYPTEAGATYYLQLVAYNTDDHFFALKPVNLAANDECSGARSYELGDTLELTVDSTLQSWRQCQFTDSKTYDRWYHFTGKDSIISFKIDSYINNSSNPTLSVLTGNCDNLQCEPLTQYGYQFSFMGDAGKDYWLNISNAFHFDIAKNITVSSVINTPVANEVYTDAITLACGDTLSGSLKYALADFEIENFNSPRIWYKVVGGGEFYVVSAKYRHQNRSPAASFYTLDAAGLPTFYTSTNNTGVFLEKDVTYYVSVHNYYTPEVINFYQPDTFDISLRCIPVLPNDICSTATAFELQDTLTGSIAYSLLNPADACTRATQSDGWYRFTGDGSLQDLIFKRANSFQYFSLAKGSCEALECVYPLEQKLAGNNYSSRFFLEDGVEYFLKVYSTSSSANWQELPFTFYFDQQEAAENDVCTTASVLQCGAIVQDSLDLATPYDPLCEGELSADRGIWYHIAGDGKYYELNFPQFPEYDLHSSVDLTLFRGDCGQLSCINENLKNYSRKFVFLAESGQDYYLLVKKLKEVSFSVSCIDVVDNDLYENAIEVSCGGSYTGYDFDPSYTEVELCQAGTTELHDLWFRVEGQDELFYYHPNSSMRARLSRVYTLKHGELQCFGNFDAQRRIFLPAGQVYYLRLQIPLYFLYNNSYDYDLSFSCYPKAANDDCISAFELYCGESFFVDNTHATNDTEDVPCGGVLPATRPVWFRIEGDDNWKDIEIQKPDGTVPYLQVWTYRGSCDELVCLKREEIFFAEAGTIYYVNVSGAIGPMTVSMTCPDPVENDFCYDARLINCGDTIQASLDYARLCDYEGECPFDYPRKKIWYEVLGQGELINLQLSSYFSSSLDFSIQIYEGNCCSLPTVENTYGTQQDQYFLAKAGKKYLIAIELKSINYDGRFKLVINCLDLDDFSICENALDIDDQQLYLIDPNQQLPYVLNSIYYPDLVSWLQFTGSGGEDTLYISHGEQVDFWPHLLVSTDGQCALTREIHSPLHRLYADKDNTAYTIQTLPGQKYMLALEGPGDENPSYFNVQLRKANFLNSCNIQLPAKFAATYQGSLQIPISISGDAGPFEVFVHAGKRLNTSTSIYHNVINNTSISYKPSQSGFIVVEFGSIRCQGHAISHIILTGIPEKECSEESLACRESIELSTPHRYGHIYDAAEYITSSARVDSTAEVWYRAGESIKLIAGFQARQGSQFRALLQPCYLTPLATDSPADPSVLKKPPMSPYPGKAHTVDLEVFPNPLSQSATIRFELPESSYCNLYVYDMRGKLMTQLLNADVPAGLQQTSLQANDLPIGIYYLSLQTDYGVFGKAINIAR